jgi:hypothetical protein
MRGAFVTIAAGTIALAGAASAQGPIGTVQQGRYVCETPGDAAGPRGVELEGAGFRIENASRYTSPTGSGTYLRRGDHVTFTSGERNGERYLVVSPATLRRLENGEPSRIQCVRQGR